MEFTLFFLETKTRVNAIFDLPLTSALSELHPIQDWRITFLLPSVKTGSLFYFTNCYQIITYHNPSMSFLNPSSQYFARLNTLTATNLSDKVYIVPKTTWEHVLLGLKEHKRNWNLIALHKLFLLAKLAKVDGNWSQNVQMAPSFLPLISNSSAH